MPKMHQNTFCGPDPLGEFKRFPRPSSRNLGGPTSKGREGRETQEGANEGGREGKEKEGEERERGKGGKGRDVPPLTLSPASASANGLQ